MKWKKLSSLKPRVDLPIWSLQWIPVYQASIDCYMARQLSKCSIFVSELLCQPVGVQDVNTIPDSSMTASSSYGIHTLPYFAGRLNDTRGSGWAPATSDNKTDYLQVDLGALHSVCALATQGTASEWTTQYKVSLSLDGVSWSFYQENNTVKVLERF